MADIKEVIKKVLEPRANSFKEAGMTDDQGNFKPVSSFTMTYEAPQNQLETIYYWILDFMKGQLGLEVEKVVDNFMSSPGSGHFAEMGQRATKMQEEGMKILGGLNQTIKSALNLVYDLKEFKMRLKHYDDYIDGDKKTKEGAFLALKQVWLDSVDLPRRGDGSIHSLANKIGYTTIREAFMVASTIEELDNMSQGDEAIINEQVARILKPRLKEFLDWIKYSEMELRKRFNIEKSYLKSQVGTIKLYSAWIKPYLKAAEELRQKGFDGDAALVNAFSTSMFQLTLLAKTRKPVTYGETSPKKRQYYPIIVVNFEYRGHLMQRANQRGDYAPAINGTATMNFDCYALNNEEYDLVKKKMHDSDIEESLELEGDYATESLKELEEDLREFLGDEDIDKILKKERKKDKKQQDDINPFTALISIFSNLFGNGKNSTKKEEKITDPKKIKKDNWTEKQIRVATADKASGTLYLLYDIYKKAHGMASSPESFKNQGNIPNPGEIDTGFNELWDWDWQ
jgi:hypothetical protein